MRDPLRRSIRADHPELPYEVRIELTDSSLASQSLRDCQRSKWPHPSNGAGRWSELAKTPRKIFKRVQTSSSAYASSYNRTTGPRLDEPFPKPGLTMRSYDEIDQSRVSRAMVAVRRLIQ